MATAPAPRIGEFIRTHRSEIISDWERRARELPHARQLGRLRLIDHMPNLLDVMANLVDTGHFDLRSLKHVPETHAMQRLNIGFDLESVANEYGMLRRSIIELFDHHSPGHLRVSEVSCLNEAIDASIVRAVISYSAAQERTLVALDRITEAGRGGKPLAELLPALLKVLLETTSAVDSAAIYLREGDTLRVHAAFSREDLRKVSASLAMGEGFAGVIAAEKKARELNGGAEARKRGLETIFGVPLLEGDELVGVAEIGSAHAPALSREDKILFRSMASRAASLLFQSRLRESEKLERRRAEESLRLVRRDLEDRERLIGILAHDLRNPLNTISVIAGAVLRNEDQHAMTARAAGRVAEAAGRMGRMISDLLDFTRGRLGRKVQLTRSPTDLARLCERTREELALRHPKRVITLEVAGDCEGLWDPVRLSQVVGNLLGNALQYSPPGSPVDLRLSGEGAQVLLEVVNQSSHLTAEAKSRLFEPGRPATDGQDSGGLGLGLYIVRQIVTAHGGTVGVDSDERGVTFAVHLPRQPPKDNAVRPDGGASS